MSPYKFDRRYFPYTISRLQDFTKTSRHTHYEGDLKLEVVPVQPRQFPHTFSTRRIIRRYWVLKEDCVYSTNREEVIIYAMDASQTIII
ncbi:hypothetical protein Trydic_g3748 [Trypoxylus dichotomus]